MNINVKNVKLYGIIQVVGRIIIYQVLLVIAQIVKLMLPHHGNRYETTNYYSRSDMCNIM